MSEKQHQCLIQNFQFLTKPTFILFGDSLTQLSIFSPSAWGNCLIRAYGIKADVVVRGYSGYTSAHAVDLLDFVFDPIFANLEKSLGFFAPKQQENDKIPKVPVIITCLFGSNDASLAIQKVPIQEFQANVLRVFEGLNEKVKNFKLVSQMCNVHLISISPPPISEKEWLAACPSSPFLNRTNENTKEYVESLEDSIEVFIQNNENKERNLKLHFLNLNEKIWNESTKNEKDLEDFFQDGLHLSEKGNVFLFEKILELIQDQIPEASPEKLSIPFPHWSKMV